LVELEFLEGLRNAKNLTKTSTETGQKVSCKFEQFILLLSRISVCSRDGIVDRPQKVLAA
jgi:hypothetical protein